MFVVVISNYSDHSTFIFLFIFLLVALWFFNLWSSTLGLYNSTRRKKNVITWANAYRMCMKASHKLVYRKQLNKFEIDKPLYIVFQFTYPFAENKEHH